MRQLRGFGWIDISGCEAAGLNDGIASPTRVFTGSSQENEKSYEDKNWKNSIFSGLLVDYGMNQRHADHDSNGVVTIHEAFFFAHRYAPEMTKKQKPGAQHPYLAGGDGTDWLLDPPPPPPPPPPRPSKKCLVNPVLCF
jgi:hypothetical protein